MTKKVKLQDSDVEVAHIVGPVTKVVELKTKYKMLRGTNTIKIISERRQLKGQKVSISEELTKLNFKLSEKLQEHNLIEEAWSYSSNICQKYNKYYHMHYIFP